MIELRNRVQRAHVLGTVGELLGWLRENMHQQGRRYSALELVRRVTDEELSPRHLVAYLRARYGALYLG